MQKSKILFTIFLIAGLVLWHSCDTTVPTDTSVREVRISVDSEMKMKMKMKSISALNLYSVIALKSVETNWIIVAVSASGEKSVAVSDDATGYRLNLGVGKSFFLYVGMIVGNSTNLYPIGYPGALAVLPMRKDKSDSNSILALGTVKLQPNGSIVSENDPMTALAFTPSGTAFDVESDGIADFGGCIDKNYNGLPDAFENPSAISASASIADFNTAMNSKSGNDFAFFTILFAAEPSMALYSSSPVWSNSSVTFALNPAIAAMVPAMYASSWSNKTVEVALNSLWRSAVSANGLGSQWSNTAAKVVTDPHFGGLVPSSYQSTFSNLIATVQSDPNWNNITGATNTITWSITNFILFGSTNWSFVSKYCVTNAPAITNYFISNRIVDGSQKCISNKMTNSVYALSTTNSKFISLTNCFTNFKVSAIATIITWTSNVVSASYVIGQRYTFTVPSGAPGSSVWGTTNYTSDSSTATAAVHMGKITFAAGGTFTVEITAGLSNYVGSTQNGVTTSAWTTYPKSFKIVD